MNWKNRKMPKETDHRSRDLQEGKVIQFGLTLPTHIVAAIDRYGEPRGLGRQAVIRLALYEWLQQHPPDSQQKNL